MVRKGKKIFCMQEYSSQPRIFMATLPGRGDDCWPHKSSFYGWNIDWTRQFHNLSDSYLSSAIGAHHRYNCISFTSSASSWNIWSIWWSDINGRRENSIPWSSNSCTSIFWGLWFQVPRKERCCRLPSGGERAWFLFTVDINPNCLICSNFKYLQVISRKDQAQYWYHADLPYNYVSVDQFSQRFKASSLGQKLNDELSKPYDKSKSHNSALSFDIYSLSKWEMFKACMARELLLMKRNSFVYIFKTMQVIIYSYDYLGWCIYNNILNHIKLTHIPFLCPAAHHHCIYYNDSIYAYSNNCGLDRCQLFFGQSILYNCKTHD